MTATSARPAQRTTGRRERSGASSRAEFRWEGIGGNGFDFSRWWAAVSTRRYGVAGPEPRSPHGERAEMPHNAPNRMPFNFSALRKESANMSILVVGTVAIDSIETPTQSRDNVL